MFTSVRATILAGAAALSLAAATDLAGLQQSADAPAIAALVQEYLGQADSLPSESTDGPLVRNRLRTLSESAWRDHSAWAADFLARLGGIRAGNLGPEDAITLGLLRWEAQLAAARGEFYWYDIPVTPYSSPMRVIQGDLSSAPLSTPDERQRYLDGLGQLAVIFTSMEVKLRGQADRGILLPQAEIDLVVPYLRSFAEEGDRRPLAPSEARLERLDPETRRQFGQAVAATIDQQVDPAIDRIATYVQGPYRARAGIDVGASRHPGGERYYRFLVRARTGLDLTPEAIHQIGLDEVARLERELEDVRRQAGFTGSLSEFRAFLKSDPQFVPKHPREIGDALIAAAARIEPKLGDWFGSRPKAPYGAERLSLALEPSMTYGYYQMPTAQDPKGYYLFNGSRLEQRTLLNAAALSYHELVPGHHFQINLARENETLSAFRRNSMYTAFTEGWGEYASDLAGEMGMYEKPYDHAGRLAMDLFLSTRLVVDTGMNALGWSRDRAMDYMRAHTLESDAQIATETLRYSADIPAQALAYKMGSRGIRELRERMRARIGSQFDVRRFHDAVLGHGAMPLNVLEEHLERTLAR
jgi:uncharacterized protein (DUF885 family)